MRILVIGDMLIGALPHYWIYPLIATAEEFTIVNDWKRKTNKQTTVFYFDMQKINSSPKNQMNSMTFQLLTFKIAMHFRLLTFVALLHSSDEGHCSFFQR